MVIGIEFYIHFYLGAEIIAPNPYSDDNEQSKGILTGIHGEYGPEVQFIIDGNAEEHPEYPGIENIKILLRPLFSMTYEEVRELFEESFSDSLCKEKIHQMSKSLYGLHTVISQYGDFNTIPKLLSNGFDLFGLIDSGLAIDKTKL